NSPRNSAAWLNNFGMPFDPAAVERVRGWLSRAWGIQKNRRNPMLKYLTLILTGLLVACQTAPVTPPQAVASTPVADLQLVNVQLPTPLPQEVIDTADAEYLMLTNIYERLAPSIVNIEIRA